VTPPQNAKTESGTYGASRTVRHVTQAPGHLRRLTAAVVVNDRLDAASGAGGKGTWKPRNAAELHTLTVLAEAAVGFDPARGDVVTVQDLPFDENRNAAPASMLNQAREALENSPVLVKYATLLAALLLLVLVVIRPAVRKAQLQAHITSGERAKLAAPVEPAAPPTPEQAAIETERQRVQRVFDQVADTLKRDPSQSSRLLQSWIHSD